MNAVPVAEIVRNGFVEGHHYGSLVALDADGEPIWSVGDADAPGAAALVQQADPGARHGAARVSTCRPSCWRWPAPRTRVSRSTSTGCAASWPAPAWPRPTCRRPPDYPLDDAAREQVIRDGGAREPVLMNCSGKHAAMLATCVANGWPTDTYRDPEHPLQQAIAATFAELTGEPIEVTAVDGCGAPLFSASLVGLARAFRRLALGVDGARAGPTRPRPASPRPSARTRRTSRGRRATSWRC